MRTTLLAAFVFLLALSLCKAEKVAGSVVTSQEWQVKRGTNTVEYFTGDVHYHANKNEIYSDRARFDHNSQNWFLNGHVQATRKEDSGEFWQAFGEHGFYNQDNQTGWLRPDSKAKQVPMVRYPLIGLPDHATANWVRWMGESKTILIGSVHSKGPRLESWSDKTTILESPGLKTDCSLRRVILTGSRPVARKFAQDQNDWQSAIKADILRTKDPHPSKQESSKDDNPMFCGEDRFVALGHARGWIIFHNSKKKKSKSNKKK
jgi:hypothetical protein